MEVAFRLQKDVDGSPADDDDATIMLLLVAAVAPPFEKTEAESRAPLSLSTRSNLATSGQKSFEQEVREYREL